MVFVSVRLHHVGVSSVSRAASDESSWKLLASKLSNHPTILHTSRPTRRTASMPSTKPAVIHTTGKPSPIAAHSMDQPPRPVAHNVPNSTFRDLSEFRGVDLLVHDHKSKRRPGGTEIEALMERRTLGKANWPLVEPGALKWRADRERPRVDERLIAMQEKMDSKIELEFVAATRQCSTSKRKWDCLLDHYTATSDTNCEAIYGHTLLDNYRANEHRMCGKGTSDMRCKSFRVSKDHDIDTAVCSGTHVAVSWDAIEDGDFPWLNFRPGSFQLNCHDDALAREKHWNFMHCLRDWMILGWASSANDLKCDEVVSDPTYFMTRSGDYSPFAMTHDWLNSVILYAVEGLDPEKVSVFIMDRMTVGFYTPIWQLLFAPKKQLQWFPDLREKYRGKVVCFEKAYFNIPARLSPIYNQDDCRNSSLYRLYRDLVLNSVNALEIRPAGEALIITLIVRRNYETGHPIGRRFANSRELVKALRKLNGRIVVNEVDFADVDFDQQLAISRATDILVAMHGAGLAQMMFMHPHGSVFEFFCPEKPPSNYRYKQLSMKMGLDYDSFSIENSENRIPVPQVVPKLKAMFDRTLRRKRGGV